MASSDLQGFAERVGLDHSVERLAELDTQLTALFAALAQLRTIDVTGVETAPVYLRPTE